MSAFAALLLPGFGRPAEVEIATLRGGYTRLARLSPGKAQDLAGQLLGRAGEDLDRLARQLSLYAGLARAMNRDFAGGVCPPGAGGAAGARLGTLETSTADETAAPPAISPEEAPCC